MLLLLKLLIILQMLIVVLYITFKCSRLRKSRSMTLFILVIFTGLFLTILYFQLQKYPGDAVFIADGLYLLSFIFYFIPLAYLTDQPRHITITIMTASGIYVMLIYVISHRIAQYLNPELFTIYSLGIQSILYIFTLRAYFSFIDKKFVYTIWNMDSNSISKIMGFGLSSLAFLFILNYSYIHGTSLVAEALELLFFGIILINGLNLANSFVVANKSVKKIEKKVKKDDLTRLGNREALLEDSNILIEKGIPFCLLFADLDEFKSVNDTYGHSVGDDYLVAFSNSVRKHLESNDKLYRMSGDEFAVLCSRKTYKDLLNKLNNLTFINNPMGVEFKGLSLGHAFFPEEGIEIIDLLSKADERMYQIKKKKHSKKNY